MFCYGLCSTAMFFWFDHFFGVIAGGNNILPKKLIITAFSLNDQTILRFWLSRYIIWSTSPFLWGIRVCFFFLIPCGFQGFGGLLLSEKFVEMLFQSHQLSINALRSTHLLSFGFCHVASVHISRSFQFPVYIFAFLMGCASKFAAKNNPLNFVPPLHEFILIERWLR